MKNREQITTTSIEDVYEENAQKLYKFFYFKVLDQQAAEDLVSETFLALAKKFNELEDKTDVGIRRYLYGIAKNIWNSHLRDKYANPIHSVEEIDDFSGYVDESISNIEERSLADRALIYIDQLPKSQRNVAKLRLVDGVTPTDIAAHIGKDMNYVKVNLRRAMRKLEEIIATTDLTANEHTGKEQTT